MRRLLHSQMRGILFLLGPAGARAVSLLPADCRRRMHASLEAYARRFITACRAGLPAGSVPSVVRGAIAPAVAARVALPSWRPAARLLETLPPALVPLFRDETGGLLLPDPKPAVLAAALRPKRAFGNEAQLEALYARVLAAGLARGPAPQERVRGRVGLFCVGKDADSDRLILDCNELFALPPALRVHLPTPADLASVELPPASVGQVFVSKIDLSSFYFSVLLESWLHPFFALARLSPAAMARLGVSDVFWCAGVMGWAPMVGSTQAAHLHLKAEVEAACLHLPTAEQHRLVDLTAAPQQTAVGTYIDDSLRLSLRRGVLETLLARTRVAYARAGWREAAAKTVAPTTDPTSLIGVLFSPRSRRLAPEPERLVALLRDTAAFLVTPRAACVRRAAQRAPGALGLAAAALPAAALRSRGSLPLCGGCRSRAVVPVAICACGAAGPARPRSFPFRGPRAPLGPSGHRFGRQRVWLWGSLLSPSSRGGARVGVPAGVLRPSVGSSAWSCRPVPRRRRRRSSAVVSGRVGALALAVEHHCGARR